MPKSETSQDKLRAELTQAQAESKIQEVPYYTFRPLQRHLRVLNTSGALSECACPDAAFNRHKNQRRQNLEKRVLADARQNFLLDKRKKLNYLSLGAGGLLQDYLLCGYLLLAGYSLHIYLVERLNYTKEFKNALARFVFLLQSHASAMGSDCSVEVFSSMHDFTKKHPDEVIHTALAIDFDAFLQYQAFADLLLVHQWLDPEGFIYLAWNQYEYVFRKKYSIHDAYFGFDILGWKPFCDENEYRIPLCIPGFSEDISTLKESVTKRIFLPKHCISEILMYAGLFPDPIEIKKNMQENNGIYKPKNKP